LFREILIIFKQIRTSLNTVSMKKTVLLTLAFALVAWSAPAQWINSLSVFPPSPTTADSIILYADCSFPNGSCDPSLVSFNRVGNDFYGNALHCMGLLTVICDYTDTFTVGTLPAGSYGFHFQLNAGLAPAPCTPGIVPGPADSLFFTVAPVTGLPPVQRDRFRVVYTEGRVGFHFGNETPAPGTVLALMAVDGRKVAEWPVTGPWLRPELRLTPGCYVAVLKDGGQAVAEKFVVTD
jgi:hypothetical protein